MERIELINLYDCYSSLLTSKQQNYFEDYYFNDLSLKEIAENENISRNAIFNQIKKLEKKLNTYESKLHLYDKSKKIKELIKTIDDENIKKKLEELE